MKMMYFLVLIVLMSSVTREAFWFRSPPRCHEVVVTKGHRVVIEFQEETHGDTKVSISEHDSSETGESGFASPRELFNTGKHNLACVLEKTKKVFYKEKGRCNDYDEHDREPESSENGEKSGFAGPGELYGTCKHKLTSALEKAKNVVCEKTSDISNLEEHAKEVIDEGVGKFGDPKETLSEKISEKVKILGEKAIKVAESAKNVAGKTISMVGFTDSTEGTLQDSLVKMEEWDLVDSPKRIGEDIERNASKQIHQGVEEVKESSLNDLSKKSKNTIHDVFFNVIDKIRSMISWVHLFGFSMAYGMGVWVTFCSNCVLGKCLPKQQFGMVMNKVNMVYFRGMAYCVGAALLGFLVSQGRKGVFSDKMEMFQGFNLVCALLMILINLIIFESQTTKLIVERMKIQMKEADQTKIIGEKLKKLSAYASTLNVSTLVVLTWHLAYIGQLLQARRH